MRSTASASNSRTATAAAPAARTAATCEPRSPQRRAASSTVAPGASRFATSSPISLRPPKITTNPVSAVSFMAAIIACAKLGLMAKATTRLTNDAIAFLTERHLAMLTTLRSDNSPHVVAVGFTFDPKTHIARVITSGGSQKAVNAENQGVAVLSQVDGARWLSLEGKTLVNTDADAVRDAELRYAQRYRTPRPNPKRVVIEVRVERVLGSSDLLDRAVD